MDSEVAIAAWLMNRLVEAEYYYAIHGCARCGVKPTLSNIRFGSASGGGCETCYHEYSAILYDMSCECKTPSGKPSKMGCNMKNMDFPFHDDKTLAQILDEILEGK